MARAGEARGREGCWRRWAEALLLLVSIVSVGALTWHHHQAQEELRQLLHAIKARGGDCELNDQGHIVEVTFEASDPTLDENLLVLYRVPLPALRVLRLKSTRKRGSGLHQPVEITDTSVDRIIGLDSLKRVMLENALLSSEGGAALRRRRPDLTVSATQELPGP